MKLFKRSTVTFLFVLFLNAISAQIDQGLVGKFYFDDGTALDETSTSTGQIVNANLTADRFGNANQALELITPDQYFFIENPGFDLGGSLSLSLWVNISADATGNEMILDARPSGNSTPYSYAGWLDSDNSQMEMHSNGSTVSYDEFITRESWVHLIYIFDVDDQIGKIYINGTRLWEPGLDISIPMPVYNGESIYIGARNDLSSSSNFEGKLDDIRIYDRVLCTQDILEIFNEHTPTDSGLVGKFYFNDGTATNEGGTSVGSLNNASLTEDRFGNPDRAIDLTNANEFFSIEEPEFNIEGAFSLNLWVNINGNATGNEMILDIRPNGFMRPYAYASWIDTDNNDIELHSNGVTITFNYTFPKEEWVQLSYIFDTNEGIGQIYINGEELEQSNLDTSIPSPSYNKEAIYIGARKDLHEQSRFEGKMDDIQIFTRALCHFEIEELFKETDPLSSTDSEKSQTFQADIFPNPVTDELNIKLNQPIKDFSFEIRNSFGQLIQSGSDLNISLFDYPTGVYFISCFKENSVFQIEKIIKK